MWKKREEILKFIFYLTLFLLPIIFFSTLKASTTGKISGRVIDATTGEVLVGANVIIEGTTLGAAADMDGDYFILNVPVGTYTVSASMIGYKVFRKTGVKVYLDKTTKINFSLSQTAIEGSEVVVEAEKPVIQTDIASSLTVLSRDQISSVPVFSFKDVLDKQVGIREADARGIFIRGEREYGISILIDGNESRDNIDNQVETRINPDAVEEANITTGGFSAEYGNATSGIVNVILKEGGNKYEATFDARMSIPTQKHFGPSLKEYYDRRFDNREYWENQANPQTYLDSLEFRGVYEQFLGKPELLRELYLWRMRDEVTKYGDKSDVNYRGTFGGPVPLVKKTNFFLSGLYEKTYYLFNQAQPYYDNLSFSGKVTSQITPKLKIYITGRYTELSGINRYDRKETAMSLGIDRLVDPLQTRENRYVFESVEDIAWTASVEQAHLSPWPYLDRMSISNRFKNQWGIKLSHVLSSHTFYEVSIIYNTFRVFGAPSPLRDTTQIVTLRDNQGNVAVLNGEYAVAPVGHWFVEFSDPLGMGKANLMGGSHGNFESSRDKTFAIRANMTSQLNKVDQVTAGFEFMYTDLNKQELREGSDNKRYEWKWHVFPKIFAGWIQNKLEFEGMIANIGLRADVRIPHHEWMDYKNNRYAHYWSSWFRDGYRGPDSISAGPRYKPPVKWILSPRLSVSHPIGSSAKIYFNYTHQNQNPPYENQYRFMVRSDIDGWDVFGDPELPFIKTIQYEVGYEQNISNLLFVSVSGYYKDVKNKLVDTIYQGDNNSINGSLYVTTYRVYEPDLFSSARGLQLRLEKRIGRFWSGWLNIDYEIFSSSMKGFSTYFENSTRIPEARNEDLYSNSNRKLTPMPRMNLGLNFYTPPRFGPKFGSLSFLGDLRLNLLFWWRSQPTFTYNPYNLDPPYAPRDNKRWKAHRAVNLTFSKRFNFGKFITPVFSIQVYNLFNTKNMFRGAFTLNQREVYMELLKMHGGNPGERGDLALQAIENQPEVEGPGTTPYDLFLNPRQIFLGIRFEFK